MTTQVTTQETPEQKKARQDAIVAAQVECEMLTSPAYRKTRDTRQRVDYLLARISALKAGFSPDTLNRQNILEIEDKLGWPRTRFERPLLDPERRAEMRMWRDILRNDDLREIEKRVGLEGSTGAQLLALSGLGAFVPLQFFDRVFFALKTYSPLFDPLRVSYLETEVGSLLHTPLVFDIDQVAVPVAEGVFESDQDIQVPQHASTQPKTYRTPRWIFSLEAEQDLARIGGAVDLFEKFTIERVARGVGSDLLNGSGVGGHIAGLITQLLATNNSVGRIATGSAESTGGTETGSNSVGVSDLAALYYGVDQRYRHSAQAAFIMSDDTARRLQSIVNKFGGILWDVRDGVDRIFGKPVLIDPNMQNVGPSNIPVVFGDLGYWLTHCATPSSYIQRYTEAQALVEKGLVALRAFVRYDGALLWNGPATANPPIRMIQNHS